MKSNNNGLKTYLNGYNSSGTFRKKQELKDRTLLAEKIWRARSSITDRGILNSELEDLEKKYQNLANSFSNLTELRSKIWKYQNTLKYLKGDGVFSKLIELKNKNAIDEIKAKLEKIYNQYGNLTEINKEINQIRNQLDQISSNYSGSIKLIESSESIKTPQFILNEYYDEKFQEFQKYQQQLLEEENQKPVCVREIMEKYKVCFMHGISTVDVIANTAVTSIDFETRLKITLLYPALSAFSYGENVSHNQMWSDIHIIFTADSYIYNASDSDLGTHAKNFRTRSPISPDYQESVNQKIEETLSKTRISHNEFIIIGKPAGLNVSLEQIELTGGEFGNTLYSKSMEPKILAGLKLGLPLFGSKNGKIYKIKYTPILEVEKLKQPNIIGQKSLDNYTECFEVFEEITVEEIALLKTPVNIILQRKIVQEFIEQGLFTEHELPLF